MSDPDGNTAMERLHNDGLETWEEALLQKTCVEIVDGMFMNDDQRAIEIFDELGDTLKAKAIRVAFAELPKAYTLARHSYGKYPFIQERAWELIEERRRNKHEI